MVVKSTPGQERCPHTAMGLTLLAPSTRVSPVTSGFQDFERVPGTSAPASLCHLSCLLRLGGLGDPSKMGAALTQGARWPGGGGSGLSSRFWLPGCPALPGQEWRDGPAPCGLVTCSPKSSTDRKAKKVLSQFSLILLIHPVHLLGPVFMSCPLVWGRRLGVTSPW